MSVARPRPRRTTALAVAAVAVLALAGCDDKDPGQGARPADGASSSGTPSAGTSAATGAPSGSASAGASTAPAGAVDLLSAGSGPRRVLTLDLEKGHEETTALRLTMRMDLGAVGTVEVPFSVPLRTTVTAADDDGYATASVLGRPTVDGGKVPAGLGPTIEQTLALMEGTTLRQTLGRDGTVRSSQVDVPDDAPDVVARMMDTFTNQAFGLAVPFPAEEVGVGARWRSVTSLDLSGAASTVTATYRLSALSDDGYTLEVSMQQRTRPGSVPGGGTIVKGSASGSGTVTGRTGLVLPVSSRATLDGTTVVEVGGQRVRTSFGTTLRLTTR